MYTFTFNLEITILHLFTQTLSEPCLLISIMHNCPQFASLRTMDLTV